MPADIRTLPTRSSLLAIGALGVALTLAACGGSSGASSGGSASASPSRAAGGAGSGAAVGRGPAAAGKVAAITGTTMQVQSQQSGQVAVTWTGATTFTHQVSAKAAAIRVGACVTAVGGAGASTNAASFTAATLIVSAARNGSCDGGFGGPRTGKGFPSGGRPSGFPSGARPSGFPTGARSSGRVGAVASGKVTAVSGSSITLAARTFGSSTATTARTVTVSATTKVRTEAATTAKSLAVGECVTAQGKADSSGTVSATRVQITEPTNGECTTGFGRVGSGG